MSRVAYAFGYDEFCMRRERDGEELECLDEQDDERRAWASIEATENTNGENTMAQQFGFDNEPTETDGRSGVFVTATAKRVTLGGRQPTVQEIDAMHAAAEGDLDREHSAYEALSCLTADTCMRVLGELLSGLDHSRATAVMLDRVCGLPDEHLGTVAKQTVQLLASKCRAAKAKADAARDLSDLERARQRGAEAALISAVGPCALQIFGGE